MGNIVQPSSEQLWRYERKGLVRIDLGIDCMSSFTDSNITIDNIPFREGFIDVSCLKKPIGFWSKGGKNFERLLVFSEKCSLGCIPPNPFDLDQTRILNGFDYSFNRFNENIYVPIYQE